MLSTLRAFGLGDKFARWIVTLYSNIKVTMVLNVHTNHKAY